MSNHRKNDRKVGAGPFDEVRLGFDGLLGALSEVITEVSQRLQEGEEREVRKHFDVETGDGPIRAEAGIRVRFADQGLAQGSSSSPLKRGPVNQPQKAQNESQNKAPPRKIDLEIVEENESWRLTADIPGVDPRELVLSDDNGELVIQTTGARRFEAACPLPAGIGADDLKVTLRNGILELMADTERTDRE